jgi:hypothetical protein
MLFDRKSASLKGLRLNNSLIVWRVGIKQQIFENAFNSGGRE